MSENKTKKKCTLFEKLIQDGWFDNEKEIEPWLMSRRILVDNEPVTSGKVKINIESNIRIKEYYKKKYVNKGGLKLEKAIQDFKINVDGKVTLDCGASTGGFTDCLLQHGAKKVYAVDVGFGQLAGKLLQDSRVVNMERTNLSDAILTTLEEKPEIISLDLSYLSLRKAVPICKNIMGSNGGVVLCLVKPIYEVDSTEVRRTGEINDEKFFKCILEELATYFDESGYCVRGVTYSPVTGNNGTVEFFLYIDLRAEAAAAPEKSEIYSQIEDAIISTRSLQKFSKNV